MAVLSQPQYNRCEKLAHAWQAAKGDMDQPLPLLKSFHIEVEDRFSTDWSKGALAQLDNLYGGRGYVTSTSLMLPDVPFLPFKGRDVGMILLSRNHQLSAEVLTLSIGDAMFTDIKNEQGQLEGINIGLFDRFVTIGENGAPTYDYSVTEGLPQQFTCMKDLGDAMREKYVRTKDLQEHTDIRARFNAANARTSDHVGLVVWHPETYPAHYQEQYEEIFPEGVSDVQLEAIAFLKQLYMQQYIAEVYDQDVPIIVYSHREHERPFDVWEHSNAINEGHIGVVREGLLEQLEPFQEQFRELFDPGPLIEQVLSPHV